jgi:hypothetical protein
MFFSLPYLQATSSRLTSRGIVMNTRLTILLALALSATLALAQSSVGGGGSSSRNRGPEPPSLGGVTTISGEVLQIDTARHAIQIRSERNGKAMTAGFALDPKCKIKADKKDFDKKELELKELEAGYRVELTIRQTDRQVIEMKVKKPKEKEDK